MAVKQARSKSLKNAGLKLARSIDAALDAADDAAAVFEKIALKLSRAAKIAAKVADVEKTNDEDEEVETE